MVDGHEAENAYAVEHVSDLGRDYEYGEGSFVMGISVKEWVAHGGGDVRVGVFQKEGSGYRFGGLHGIGDGRVWNLKCLLSFRWLQSGNRRL